MKKAIIYYFSGTGNSKHVAEICSGKLGESGYEVNLHNIEKSVVHPEHNKADLIGFSAPVYGFGLPGMMVNFIRRLPESDKQRTFLFISTGNVERITISGKTISVPPHEGICVLQFMWLMKWKGYNVQNARVVEMPTSWILATNPPEGDYLKEIYSKADEFVINCTSEILEPKKVIQIANPVLIVLLGFIYILFYYFARPVGGKLFVTSRKCNSCQTCVKICPTKTIKMSGGKPYWNWNCDQCFRCINSCPNEAIEVSALAFIIMWLACFFADIPYMLIPVEYLAKLAGFSILAHLLIYLFTLFLVLWLMHLFLQTWPTAKIFPKWYMTKKRIRYNVLLKDLIKNLK